MSSASWAKKLNAKLASLPDNASKESIQTVANWITFNRKHGAVIAAVMTEKLLSPQNKQLYWQLVHEILISERDHPSKWEKLLDLRVALGEGLVGVLEQTSSVPPEVENNLKDWSDLNVFGGSSLASQLKRLYQSNKNGVGDGAAAEDTSAATEPKNEAVKEESTKPAAAAAAAAVPEVPKHEEPEIKKETPATKPVESSPTQCRSSFAQNNQQVDYDFESKNVPARKVEPKEFLEPCKAIATLQIARDLRSDKHIEISNAIAALKPEILQTCRDMEDGKKVDDKTIQEYSFQIPTQLLDLDMTEEQSQLQTFQDILQQQIQARKKLIHLLLESRCQFGSDVAAKEFYDMDGALTEQLKKRKQLLSDALELEGLDTSEIEAEHAKQKQEKGVDDEQELPPLKWYQPEEAAGVESASKKQRTS